MTVEEVRDDLAGFDLDNDSWRLAFFSQRPMASHWSPSPPSARRRAEEEFRGQVSVHPDWRRPRHRRPRWPRSSSGPSAIGSPPIPPRRPRSWASSRATRRRSASRAESLGYSWSRRFWRMRIDLESPPPEPPVAGRHHRARLRAGAGRAPPCTTLRRRPSPITGATFRVRTRTSSSASSAATSIRLAVAHGAGRRSGRGHRQQLHPGGQ